jgi:diguanylate cyclase (GGDEF)-like protein
MNVNFKCIDDQPLQTLTQTIPFPIVIFNQERLLFYDDKAKKLLCDQNYDVSYIDLFHSFKNAKEPLRRDLILLNPKLEKIWFNTVGEIVEYKNEIAIMLYIIEKSERKQDDSEILRLSKLSQFMLEINQSIVNVSDLKRTFNLILVSALKALDNASLGSIFIKNKDVFEIVSYIGFDKSIVEFKLPIADSFLYRNTDGLMDRIANIPKIQIDDHFYRVKTFAGYDVFIKSEISAPIYVNGELYGMINIDSLEENAFNESDYASMEFICSNIQIAISNQISYLEKSRLAMLDPLTKLYNRHYFEEQFIVCKKRAVRYEEKFHLVIFDVDDLKIVNDLYGHTVGDKVIKHIASEIQERTRQSDVIARYGGDEFLGLFLSTSFQALRKKITTIENLINLKPLQNDDKLIYFHFSFGIASFPKDGNTLNELLEVADKRMYIDKKNKKEFII